MSPRQSWLAKFKVAIVGLREAIRSQPSFWVHLIAATMVLILAAWLQVESWRWVALTIVITSVIAAELINTSIETLVRVIHPQQHPQIGHALDVAAAAVLVTSGGAVVVGLVTLGVPLYQALSP